MAKYTEKHLQNALFDITNGMLTAYAARKWGVPRTTLASRKNHHHEPRRLGAAHLQKVSPTQEAMLANWIRVQEALSFPPTHACVRYFASRLLGTNGDNNDSEMLGNHWIQFFKRNPSVKTKHNEQIEVERAQEATSDTIAPWFQLFDNPVLQSIPPEYRYNMDKAGIMEGLGANGLVVGASELRKAYTKELNRGSWMTFVECISAAGHALDPLVIFRGQTLQQQWFPNNELYRFQQWYFSSTENGWTSNDNALEWLIKLFIPRTRPNHNDQYRLLILDGHGSHVTDEFMWQCHSWCWE